MSSRRVADMLLCEIIIVWFGLIHVKYPPPEGIQAA